MLVQHGTNDPLIPVQRSRDLARQLRTLGVPTVYREYPMEHQVAIESLRDAADVARRGVLAGERPDEPVPDDPVELVPSVTTARVGGGGVAERRCRSSSTSGRRGADRAGRCRRSSRRSPRCAKASTRS